MEILNKEREELNKELKELNNLSNLYLEKEEKWKDNLTLLIMKEFKKIMRKYDIEEIIFNQTKLGRITINREDLKIFDHNMLNHIA